MVNVFTEPMGKVLDIYKNPEVKVYITQDRAWKERYHQNMFDAVALGMMVKS